MTTLGLSALLGTMPAAQAIERGSQIAICHETNAEWPPYVYYRRVNGIKTGTLTGLPIEVLDKIFAQHGLRYTIKYYPWKRCMSYLESGEEIQMVLTSPLNEERKGKYLVSNSVYTVTPSYFYRKERYPAGLRINRASDLLDRGTVCGRLGYNYQNFGIDSSRMDTGAKDFDTLMRKLESGRCDIVLARYEIVAGFKLIGTPYLNSDIAHAPMPGRPGESFHFLISRNYRHGQELLQILNRGIAKLRREGQLKEILDKHLQD